MPTAKSPSKKNPTPAAPAKSNRKPQAAFILGLAGWEDLSDLVDDCLIELHSEISPNLFAAISQTNSEIANSELRDDDRRMFHLLQKLQKQSAKGLDSTHPYGEWLRLGDALGSCRDRWCKPAEYRVKYQVKPDLGNVSACIRALPARDVRLLSTIRRLKELKLDRLTLDRFLEWWRQNYREIIGRPYLPVPGIRDDPFRDLAAVISRELLKLPVKRSAKRASGAREKSAASPSPRKPRWNRDESKLFFGKKLIKKIRRPSNAMNVIQVFDTFENQGWPSRIDDPLTDEQGTRDQQRLHLTIRSLNRDLKLIRFHADGYGTGIIWQKS